MFVGIFILLMVVVGCNSSSEKDSTKNDNNSNGENNVETDTSTEEFPSKPIEFVVPYSPGGGNDILARAIAGVAGSYFDVPIQIVNMPGAGGSVGLEYIANSDPDGHTIGISTDITAVTYPLMYDDAGYQIEDLAAAIQGSRTELVMLANVNSEWESMEDVIAYAEEHPGELTYSSPGVGNALHLGFELLFREVGVELTHIPYEGSSEALHAVASGEADLVSTTLSSAVTAIEAEQVKPLAITSEERSEALEDVPTLIEQGYDFTYLNYRPIYISSGVPEERRVILEEKFMQIFTDEAYIELAKKLGEYPSEEIMGHEEMTEHLYELSKEFKPVIEEVFSE